MPARSAWLAICDEPHRAQRGSALGRIGKTVTAKARHRVCPANRGRIIAGSRLFRPATGAMEDAENVDSVANDAVRQDVRRTRYGKLPRFCESSRGDRFRQSGKLALGTIHDARNHRVGSTLTVLRHVRAERAKVR